MPVVWLEVAPSISWISPCTGTGPSTSAYGECAAAIGEAAGVAERPDHVVGWTTRTFAERLGSGRLAARIFKPPLGEACAGSRHSYLVIDLDG
jgi:hypothetical protein